MHTMYAPTSMHNTIGKCVPMPLCMHTGRVGKHMPTYFHTLICRFDARMHVAILSALDAQHVCTNLYAQHCRQVCAHASVRASRTRGKAHAHLFSHTNMQIQCPRACSNSAVSRCTACVHQPLYTTLQASMCPCHHACVHDAWEHGNIYNLSIANISEAHIYATTILVS